MKRALLLMFGLVAVSACGSNSATAPSSSTAQISGIWRGTARTQSISGGECLGAILQGSVNSADPVTVSFAQTGSNVTATLTVDSTGGNYSYTGSVGQSAVSLTGTGCSACNLTGAKCSATAARDMRLQSVSVTGTVTGTTMAGTQTEAYNVLVSGTATSVGAMTVTSAFTVTKQ